MEKKELRKIIEELNIKRQVAEIKGETPDYDTDNRYHYLSEDDILALLEKAREEGREEYQKSEFLIDSAGNVYMDTMPRIRIGDNTKHDGTTVGDFRRLYYKIN